MIFLSFRGKKQFVPLFQCISSWVTVQRGDYSSSNRIIGGKFHNLPFEIPEKLA